MCAWVSFFRSFSQNFNMKKVQFLLSLRFCLCAFSILNLLTEHLIKIRHVIKTPGRISIAVALQNDPNEKNSKRQTTKAPTITTAGNNVSNIFHLKERLRWRVQGDGAVSSIGELKQQQQKQCWLHHACRVLTWARYQLKQFSMPKTLPFFFPFMSHTHINTHTYSQCLLCMNRPDQTSSDRTKDKIIEHHI